MSRLRVHAFTISLDGFGAGPEQGREYPLGRGGEELHEWMFPTRTFMAMQRKSGGTAGIADDLTKRGFEDIGAWIMGRNMFGPVRGPWPDDKWRGWWGENPPYHAPVYVLTHHRREPLEMQGGTVFHFVSDPIDAVLRQAQLAAGAKDIRLAGGVSTIRQYLQAKLVDEIHFAISPRVLGSGEHLFAGLDLLALGYHVSEHVPTAEATHVVLARRG